MGNPKLPVYGQEKAKRLPDDLTGRRFGHLVVLERILPNVKGGSRWLCKCDCGTVKRVRRENLVRGTESCGCISRVFFGKRARLPFHDVEENKGLKINPIQV